MPQNSTPTLKYSMQVLEECPPRAARFLNAIGAGPVIRTLMAEAKMTDADIAEGGKLMVATWSHTPPKKADQDTAEAREQRAAVAELDQWDEPNFGRYRATLRRHYPSAGEYVFHNLTASTGAAAVAGVGTFLSRVESLEKGTDPERSGTKKDDKKAVELLADRGLDKAERARLAALVQLALKPTAALEVDMTLSGERSAARIEALTALKDWYEEWAGAARAVVKKRAYLIRMGLTSRKSRKGEPEGNGGTGTGTGGPA